MSRRSAKHKKFNNVWRGREKGLLTEVENLGLGHAGEQVLLEQVLVCAVCKSANGELICSSIELHFVVVLHDIRTVRRHTSLDRPLRRELIVI